MKSIEPIAAAGPVLAVFGPRRSGTNFIANLLLINTVHPVANFDERPAQRLKSNSRIKFLNSTYGSKHNLSDRDQAEKYPPDAVYVFVFKPIFSWALSRVAYRRSLAAALPAAKVLDFVRRVVDSEYLSMLRTLVNHLGGPLKDARVALVNYELTGLDSLESLFRRLGLEHQTPIQGIAVEMRPGGGTGQRFVRKGPEQLVPETDLHAGILEICAQALKASDPCVLGLYDQITGPEPFVLPEGHPTADASTDSANQLLASFWLGRFTVRPHGASDVVLKDRLQPGGRVVPRALFAGLSPRTRDLTYFRHGFVPPALGAVGATVVEAARGPDDLLVWQGPARTEQAAMAAHAGLAGPLLADGAMHVYLGLPWATWIDQMLQSGQDSGAALPAAAAQQLQLVGIQLVGYRQALAELGTQLRVHTVCQHVQWPQILSAWRELGVTDLWLAHGPEEDVPGVNVRPWRLGPTQLEDLGQPDGLPLMADPETKALLASFVGHLSDSPTGDIRPRLSELSADKRVRITLLPAAPAQADAGAPAWPETAVDNQELSESVFSLCPAGAVANMSRLWQSLAVGAVPVLIGGSGAQPRLPEGGSLPAIDWSSIVLRVSADDLAELPALLASMPMDEVRRRQQLGRDALEQVGRHRCF